MFKFNIKLNNEHRLKTIANNEHKFRTSVRDAFIFISKSIEATITKYINLNTLVVYSSKIANRIVIKTKLIIKSTTSSFAEAMLQCKMRINSLLNSMSVVSGKLKSKMRFGDEHHSDVVAKIIGRAISRFKNTAKNDSGGLDTLLHAKARIEEELICSKNVQTHMYAKVKLDSSSDNKTNLFPYRVKVKKLNVYEGVKLSELPYTLKNFCFYIKNDNWKDVQASYSTWEELKMNVLSWEELIE